jgi:hypothetical protein
MKKIFLLGAFALSLSLVSCEDKDEPPTTPTETKVTPKLMYNYNFGASDFSLGQYYALATGEQVKFDIATFYISMPTILDDANVATPLTPEYIIVRPGDGATTFDAIEAVQADRFVFNLGIDEATNTENGANGVQPSDFTDPANPLAPQVEGMYWAWASGYIFIKLEGNIDYDGDGQADATFKYHLGLNDLLQVKDEMLQNSMTAGENFDMTMTINLQEVFTNVDINSELLTMSMGGGAAKALADKISQNFAAGVSISTAP